MKIDILTLFPESFKPLEESIVKRAGLAGKVKINIINIRDFSEDKHKKCDDATFGGGAGMLMTPVPIHNAIMSIKGQDKAEKIYLSPRGQVFTQSLAETFAENDSKKHLIFLCGHYEGVDQRVLDMHNFRELSIGDFVLSGGEIAAMAVIDAIVRLIPGVLSNEESTKEESISSGMLEYPQYTRPADFMGIKVPQVLLSGNHAKIKKWREEQALELTKKTRPDLLRKK